MFRGILPVVATAVALTVSPAPAVVKLEMTLGKTYKDSRAVVVGAVTAVRADARLIEVRLEKPLKGESPKPQFRIQAVSPADLIAQVQVGQPIVVMESQASQGMALVHVADSWYLAKAVPGTDPPVWRTAQAHEQARASFPGRGTALVRLLEEIKAGKSPIADRYERKPFAGGVRQRGKLPAKPDWMLAAPLRGEKAIDLIVGEKNSAAIFPATGSDFDFNQAIRATLKPPAYRAVGDTSGDGRPEVLLGSGLWSFDGKKLTAGPELALVGSPLAAAIVDVTGDQQPDVVAISSAGELVVCENPGPGKAVCCCRPAKTLWKGGEQPILANFGDWGDTGKPHLLVVFPNRIVRYALDDAGGPPAELDRLTGIDIRKNPKYKDGLGCRFAAALDMDGDRRPDLLVLTSAGGLLLVNRGYGAFLLDQNLGPALSGLPFQPDAATPWAAADLAGHGCDDLLLAGPDGTLYEADNGPN